MQSGRFLLRCGGQDGEIYEFSGERLFGDKCMSKPSGQLLWKSCADPLDYTDRVRRRGLVLRPVHDAGWFISLVEQRP